MHWLEAFLLIALPTQNLPPSWCNHELGRRKVLIPPRQHCFENLFPSTAENPGGNYDLPYEDSVKKYEDD